MDGCDGLRWEDAMVRSVGEAEARDEEKGRGDPRHWRNGSAQPRKRDGTSGRLRGASGDAALCPLAALLGEAANGSGDALGLFGAVRAGFEMGADCGWDCAEEEVGELSVC